MRCVARDGGVESCRLTRRSTAALSVRLLRGGKTLMLLKRPVSRCVGQSDSRGAAGAKSNRGDFSGTFILGWSV